MSTEPSTFALRLKSIIDNDSMNHFAKKCQLSESAIRKYLRGDSEPTLQNLLAMAKAGNVSVAWLASGDTLYAPTPNKQPITQNRTAIIAEISFTSLKDFNLDNYLNDISSDVIAYWGFSQIWLTNNHLSASDLVISTLEIDNMYPTFKPGDIALLNIGLDRRQPMSSGLYILLFNDYLVVNRLQYDAEQTGYWLINDNERYPNKFIKLSGLTSFKIIAKVEQFLTRAL